MDIYIIFLTSYLLQSLNDLSEFFQRSMHCSVELGSYDAQIAMTLKCDLNRLGVYSKYGIMCTKNKTNETYPENPINLAFKIN